MLSLNSAAGEMRRVEVVRGKKPRSRRPSLTQKDDKQKHSLKSSRRSTQSPVAEYDSDSYGTSSGLLSKYDKTYQGRQRSMSPTSAPQKPAEVQEQGGVIGGGLGERERQGGEMNGRSRGGGAGEETKKTGYPEGSRELLTFMDIDLKDTLAQAAALYADRARSDARSSVEAEGDGERRRRMRRRSRCHTQSLPFKLLN